MLCRNCLIAETKERSVSDVTWGRGSEPVGQYLRGDEILKWESSLSFVDNKSHPCLLLTTKVNKTQQSKRFSGNTRWTKRGSITVVSWRWNMAHLHHWYSQRQV